MSSKIDELTQKIKGTQTNVGQLFDYLIQNNKDMFDLNILTKLTSFIDSLSKLPESTRSLIETSAKDLLEIDKKISSSLFSKEVINDLIRLQRNIFLMYVKKINPDCQKDITDIMSQVGRKLDISSNLAIDAL